MFQYFWLILTDGQVCYCLKHKQILFLEENLQRFHAFYLKFYQCGANEIQSATLQMNWLTQQNYSIYRRLLQLDGAQVCSSVYSGEIISHAIYRQKKSYRSLYWFQMFRAYKLIYTGSFSLFQYRNHPDADRI